MGLLVCGFKVYGFMVYGFMGLKGYRFVGEGVISLWVYKDVVLWVYRVMCLWFMNYGFGFLFPC